MRNGASGLYDTVDAADFLRGYNEAEFIGRYGKSLETSGFVVLLDTNVDQSILGPAYAATRRLFAHTDEELHRYNGDDIGGQRGFTAYKKERAKTQTTANLMRFWMVGREENRKTSTLLPNIWPNGLVPEFRHAMMAYTRAMETLNMKLLYAQEQYLGLPNGLLQEMMRTGDTIARILHYPKLELNPDGTAKEEESEAVRAYEHEDIGWQTLLPASTSGGLEVMDHDGRWHQVVSPPGSVINNFADTGQAWLNFRAEIKRKLRSTTHRVTNGNGDERFSLPYFVHPDGSTVLDEATGWTALQYLIQRLREIGLIPEDAIL